MKKISLLLLLFTAIISNSPAQELDERWHSLMNLIDKEMRTIQSLNQISPNLRWRLIELHSEKMDLLKQKENMIFLKAQPEEIRQYGRDHYFKTTRQLEQNVSRMGLDLMKEFPRFIHNPDIHYTLALNSRDYGNNKATEKHLLEALRLADPRAPVVYNTRVALAEFYYNDNKYERAISHYSHVLKNLGDEWHTKHLYNAAWCYLKIQDLNRAIDLLVRSHDLGVQSRYISMKDQVLESAQAFFVMGERIQEGVDFYLKNATDPTPYLIRMTARTAERAAFEVTQSIIQQNTQLAKKRENWSGLIDIKLQELDIYRTFKRYDLHLQQATALNNLHQKHEMTDEQKEDAIRKITEVVGYLQIRLTNNAKIRRTQFDPALLKTVIDYFSLLIAIDPANTDRYAFFQGESFFSVQKYRDAGLAYQRGLEALKALDEELFKSKKDDLGRKLLEALLATIEYGDIPREEKERLTVYTFTNYLVFWPIDDKSRLIYRSLFNIYFQRGDNERAQGVLHTYHNNYTDEENRVIQRAMLTQIIDKTIEDKNSDRLAFWINRIQEGYLGYGADYIERATLILGQIVFEGYSALAQTGKINKALVGYQTVFNDERYPKKIKAQSSLQVALLSLQLNKQDQAYKWLMDSLALTDQADKEEILPRLTAMHEVFFLKQNFKLSADLADTILREYCSPKFEAKQSIYQNSVAFRLLDGQNQLALTALQRVRQCPIHDNKDQDHKLFLAAIANTLHFFYQHQKYREFFSFYKQIQTSLSLTNEILTIYDQAVVDLYWNAIRDRDKNLETQMIQEMSNIIALGHSNDAKLYMTQILEWRSFSDEIRRTTFKNFSTPAEYDDDLFQAELEHNLKVIASMSNRADAFIKWGRPELTIQTSELMSRFIRIFTTQLSQYRPNGVPSEFIACFVNAMEGISSQLNQNANSYIELASNLIQRHELLTPYNYLFTAERTWREKYQWSYDSKSFGLSMIEHSTGVRND
jgi:hypothetical protein